jgi:hypothetical protein
MFTSAGERKRSKSNFLMALGINKKLQKFLAPTAWSYLVARDQAGEGEAAAPLTQSIIYVGKFSITNGN